jgi:hypothetical protein
MGHWGSGKDAASTKLALEKGWWLHLTLIVYLFSLICRQDGPMPDWQGSTLVMS